jgi:anti-anti-sigma factor
MAQEISNGSFVREADGRQVIHLPAELGLATIAEWHAVLLGALEARRGVVLDATEVVEADLSGLQLLCSAHRSFAQQGIPLELRGVREEFRRTVERGGFDAALPVGPERDEN